MNFFKWLGRALAVAVSAAGLLGCGGDGNPSGGGNGGGGSYASVAIEGKKWMSKNLNIEAGNSWCYENVTDSCKKYGRLYDWATAMTICPSGWRLPDKEDWNSLVATAGGSEAGSKLKFTSGWYDNGNGTNEFGFSALPGGYRGLGNSFYHAGDYGTWWTATEYDKGGAYYRSIDYGYDRVNESSGDKGLGFSVRCVEK